jgi:hypothetical protein
MVEDKKESKKPSSTKEENEFFMNPGLKPPLSSETKARGNIGKGIIAKIFWI